MDSNASHLAWAYDIFCKTGTVIPFPIISDRNGAIARKYGMISNEVSTTETVRNIFIIDDKGVIRMVLVYPMNVGRNIQEILRCVMALQTADQNKASTPVNWIPNQPVISPTPQTFCSLQERMKQIEENRNGMNWYLSFQKPEEPAKIDTKDSQDKCNRKEEGKQ